MEQERDMWTTLRKSGAPIHASYGRGFTNNLLAHNVRVQSDEQGVVLSLDLNPNLRARNRESWEYVDARALADGDIARLTLVQLHDEHLLKGLAGVLASKEDVSGEWVLEVELAGTHRFRVTPEFKADMLWLNVSGADSV
jgi:hypothetical protein